MGVLREGNGAVSGVCRGPVVHFVEGNKCEGLDEESEWNVEAECGTSHKNSRSLGQKS